MQRRELLKALLAAPAAAMAAHFGVSKSMAGEIREELEKDLLRPDRTYIQMPGPSGIMLPSGLVWASSDSITELWRDELAAALRSKGRLRLDANHEGESRAYYDQQARKMLRQMTSLLNSDLESARLESDSPLIAGVPIIGYDGVVVTLTAGLHQQPGPLGPEYYVGANPNTKRIVLPAMTRAL